MSAAPPPTTAPPASEPPRNTPQIRASNRLYDVPPLEDDGNNFPSWKFRTQKVLEIRGLWDVVDHQGDAPGEASDQYEEWKAKDREASAQITLTLKDEPLNTVMYATSAHSAWELLRTRYEGKGEQKVAYLISELFRSTLTDDSPLEPQINSMRRVAHTLHSLGHKLEDKLVAVAIILSLPPSYDTLRTILTSQTDKLTLETITSQVLQEEQRRRETAQTSAFAARTFGSAGKLNGSKSPSSTKGSKSSKAKDKGKPYCKHCRFTGHTREECRKYAAKVAEGKGEKAGDEKANIARDDEPIRTFVAQGDSPRRGDLSNEWVIDSGATRSMSSKRSWFHTYRELAAPRRVWLGDNSSIEAVGVGQILTEMCAAGHWSHVMLQDVLYVPKLHGHLMSVPQLAQRQAHVHFINDNCAIRDKDGVLTCEGRREGNLYILRCRTIIPERAYISRTTALPNESPSDTDSESAYAATTTRLKISRADAQTWHRRLGHISVESVLKMMKKGMVKGMEITGNTRLPGVCKPCLVGKQTRKPIAKEAEVRATRPLQRIHSDVCGPFQTASRQGFNYFVTWIDDASRRVIVNGIRHKSEVEACYRDFITRAEVETGERSAALRSDAGGEYSGATMQTYLKSKGILHEVPTAETPEHDGVSERMNRTLVENARAMLEDAGLPKSYWYDAVEYAALVHNVSPTRSLKGNVTPEEVWSGNKPSVAHLRVFGCTSHVLIPKAQRRKLDAKSLECSLIGYLPNRRAYRLVHRPSGRIVESRNVVFNEGPGKLERVEISAGDTSEESDGKGEKTPVQRKELEISQNISDAPLTSEALSGSTRSTSRRPEPPVELRRSTRKRNTPVRDDDARYDVTSYARKGKPPSSKPQPARVEPIEDDLPGLEEIEDSDDEDFVDAPEVVNSARSESNENPPTFAAAMASGNAAEWLAACQEEMKSLETMDVFEEVERPRGRKIVGSKWVLRIKRGPNGEVEKYKARLVAKGFTQVEGIDYDETFAPVVKFTTLRTILALAAEMDLEVHQLDVKTAYLNGVLDEEIFLEPPEGFKSRDGIVWRLKKSLYGLKQAGRVWYKRIRREIESLGFTACASDPCLFYKVEDGKLTLIAVYVDDMILASKALEDLESVKNLLKKSFSITDLGEANWILGIHIERDRGTKQIRLSQEQYIEEVLSKFDQQDARPMVTPMLASQRLVRAEQPEVDTRTYQRILGSVMWAMLGTRPDLAFAVGTLSQFSSAPTEEALCALMRVLKYLRGTSKMKLTYQGGPKLELTGFVDADWAGNVNDRRSISGFVFKIANGAISWSSKKQASTALSSTEAEYVAGAHAAKELVWLRALLAEIGSPCEGPTVLLMDNQSAMAIAENPVYHARTKHIAVRHHFLREKVEDGDLKLKYLPTGDQVADVLTKSLAREKHERFTKEMGLRRVG